MFSECKAETSMNTTLLKKNQNRRFDVSAKTQLVYSSKNLAGFNATIVSRIHE